MAAPTDDNEWVEEEQLVLVELSGIIDTDFLSKERRKCKLLGVETKQPVLQIDRYIFTGDYKDTLGTAVIFEEVNGPGDDKQLKYNCHTFKRLEMNRAFLSERKDTTQEATASSDTVVIETD
ncbi:general transcription factor 3C polypeptide 6-like [Saccoglossus kowalevskii]|uniref:General transcription factor 3C polypeptide 6-like n=1 Tax=Saccoglossus kowalevskii TaxID=10224 RepID=A0ABM0M6B9_SACKO|nr:PREDICTED: general transcription factor 3C polypeptide 6-like [Saccoglossus kowalevskii]